jgi:hypothetical protein
MSERELSVQEALTRVACGFSAMPLFSDCKSSDGFVHFTAYTPSQPRMTTYGLLKIRQWQQEGPICGVTGVRLAHAVLRRYGMTSIDRPISDVMSYIYVMSDAPSALSPHDQMAAIRHAREVVIEAGLDPDLT